MSIYRRGDSQIYSYDFRLAGKRYSGSTDTSDIEEARRIEKSLKDEVASLSGLCRVVLRRARRVLPQETNAASGYVYMLKSGYFIKIGHSVDPHERIQKISTSLPTDCELLFCFRGGAKLERALHAEFDACRYQREWFFLCGKLKHFIDEVAAQLDARGEHAIPPEITHLKSA